MPELHAQKKCTHESFDNKRWITSFINLFWLIEDVCQVTAATVLSVEHVGHEDTSTAVLAGALAALTGDLAIIVNLKINKVG